MGEVAYILVSQTTQTTKTHFQEKVFLFVCCFCACLLFLLFFLFTQFRKTKQNIFCFFFNKKQKQGHYVYNGMTSNLFNCPITHNLQTYGKKGDLITIILKPNDKTITWGLNNHIFEDKSAKDIPNKTNN